MNRTYTVQQPKKKFTTFMQALIELMLAVEQVEMGTGPSTDEKNTRVGGGDAKRPPRPPVQSTSIFTKKPVVAAAAAAEQMDKKGEVTMRRTQFFEYHDNFDQNESCTTWGSKDHPQIGQTQRFAKLDLSMCRRHPCSRPQTLIRLLSARSAVRCMTKPVRSPYFALDFHGLRIVPTAYTLRHSAPNDSEAIRSWVLEGSTNGESWVVLDERKNCQDLKRSGQAHTWRVDSTSAVISQMQGRRKTEEARRSGRADI